jgi:hypothetical protein
MDDNPYEAPQVERSENDEFAAADNFAEQLEWPDRHVLGVACLLVVLLIAGPLLIAAFLPSIK